MKTPTLILKSQKAKRNIEKMKSFCSKHQMDFRPHFKTHQSIEIGNWFKENNIKKCTVSSISMAQYFAEAGWDDICVAIPLNVNELEDIETLASKVKLSLCVDHINAVKALESLTSKLNLYIEIDSGYGRSGVCFSDTLLIDSLIDEINMNKQIEFEGFLSHTGNSYASLNPDEGSRIFEEARKRLVRLKQNYLEQFPHLILSMGDTPSSTFGKDFEGIDEWRPGNFVFYDFMQYALGSCNEKDIAVSLYCPVIGVYPERGEIVVYGGGVHLSKDNIHYRGQKIFGWLQPQNQAIDDGFPVISLSQEHGIIKVNESFLNQIKIGDFVEIIPIHSCMTADLNTTYLTEEKTIIKKFRTFN